MNQKSIKDLKKRIVQESALNVGYSEGTREAIIVATPDILEKVMASGMATYLESLASNNDIGFDNAFISEAVKLMSYSDFKQVAHQFFGYTRTEEEILAEPITLSRKAYENLQKRAENNFMEMTTSKSNKRHLEISDENEAVAYNPITQEIAYLASDNSSAVPYIDENLISDYKSDKTEFELILQKLEQKTSSNVYERIKAFIEDNNLNAEFIDPESMQKFVDHVNSVIESDNQVIIQHTVQGYDQSDSWQLNYFFDENELPGIERADIVNFLEHEIGAYYRGSLAELRVLDKDDVEVENYLVDRETFIGNEINQVKAYTQNDNYVDLATGFKLQNLGVEITPEVLNDFLNNEPKQNTLKK